jgi:hypothetical protein
VTGNFGTSTSVGAPSSGDYLLGLKNANLTTADTIKIGQDTTKPTYSFNEFGFRIQGASNPNFTVTINLYASADGTGPILQTLTTPLLSANPQTNSLNCAAMTTNPPGVCNTAPFIWVSTTGSVKSFTIATSDASGFYLDALELTTVPEPGTLLCAGAGLLGLAYAIRRRRAAHSTEPGKTN